jgi:hypothetical protein
MGDAHSLTSLKIKQIPVDLYGVRISARIGKVTQDIKIIRVKDHWARLLAVSVIAYRVHLMSSATQDALTAEFKNQPEAVAGNNVMLHLEVANGEGSTPSGPTLTFPSSRARSDR